MCLCPRQTPLAAGNEDSGMADGAAVNGKWDGAFCAGMEIFLLPEIRNRSLRPP